MNARDVKWRFSKEIGARIKQKRTEQRLSQGTVATVLGLHQAALSRIESGTQEISAAEVLLFCLELKIGLEDILKKG